MAVVMNLWKMCHNGLFVASKSVKGSPTLAYCQLLHCFEHHVRAETSWLKGVIEESCSPHGGPESERGNQGRSSWGKETVRKIILP